MINSPVLDVTIGLIFIYLLYSLLATTIKEFVATLFAYRGRMLERGLEQMLDGVNYSYYWWNKLFNIIADFLNKTVTYLKWSTKPILKESKLSKKNSLFAAKFTRHQLYIRSSEQSLMSKKPAYLASDTFSDILIDLFTPKGNKNILLKDIAVEIKRQAAEPSEPLNNDLANILDIYITQANGDLQRFKLIIEKWYDDTMDRVSGWYKRQASRILIIIGFILAVIFNVSTIEIVQNLSVDKALRAAVVKSASDYIKAHPNGINSEPNNNTNTPQVVNPIKNNNGKVVKEDTAKRQVILTEKNNTAKTNYLAKIKKEIANKTTQTQAPQSSDIPDKPTTVATDSVKKLASIEVGVKNIKSIYEDIQQPNITLGLGWGDYGFKRDSTLWACKYDSITEIHCNQLIKKDSKLVVAIIGSEPKRDAFWYKIFFVLKQMWSGKKLIGFIITALAISLGAPFWFDLLNKFVSLRASGTKPNDNTKGTSKTATLNQKPDINSFA